LVVKSPHAVRRGLINANGSKPILSRESTGDLHLQNES
jgi:hypothetical protein